MKRLLSTLLLITALAMLAAPVSAGITATIGEIKTAGSRGERDVHHPPCPVQLVVWMMWRLVHPNVAMGAIAGGNAQPGR